MKMKYFFSIWIEFWEEEILSSKAVSWVLLVSNTLTRMCTEHLGDKYCTTCGKGKDK